MKLSITHRQQIIEYDLKKLYATIIADDGTEVPLQELIEYILKLKNSLEICGNGVVTLQTGE